MPIRSLSLGAIPPAMYKPPAGMHRRATCRSSAPNALSIRSTAATATGSDSSAAAAIAAGCSSRGSLCPAITTTECKSDSIIRSSVDCHAVRSGHVTGQFVLRYCSRYSSQLRDSKEHVLRVSKNVLKHVRQTGPAHDALHRNSALCMAAVSDCD
eukprot:COSAG06_NODE_11850_length_1456_cov_6.012862_3_plen_155_part_00